MSVPPRAVTKEAESNCQDGNAFAKNQSEILVLKIVKCPATVRLIKKIVCTKPK